jgi:hypothetical protein
VSHTVIGYAVHHRPFVEPEAPQGRWPGQGRAQEPVDEVDGAAAVPDEALHVEGGHVAVGAVEAPAGARHTGRVGKPHARSGMPPRKATGGEVVVLEEEVLDRVLLTATAPGEVRAGALGHCPVVPLL